MDDSQKGAVEEVTQKIELDKKIDIVPENKLVGDKGGRVAKDFRLLLE